MVRKELEPNKNGEVPGNAVESQRLFDKQMIRAASQLVHVERALERLDQEDVVVGRVVIRLPVGDGAEFLAVLNADTPEGKMVAFHRAGTFMECIVGVCERLVNGSMKWTADKYG